MRWSTILEQPLTQGAVDIQGEAVTSPSLNKEAMKEDDLSTTPNLLEGTYSSERSSYFSCSRERTWRIS